MPTIDEALHAAVRRLADAGVPTPEVDVGWLACHVLRCSRAELRGAGGRPISREEEERLELLIARRAHRQPLQHCTGRTAFRHLELVVRPRVFVPRPETELLVDEVRAHLRSDGDVVVDVCTGSGAIACALATEADIAPVIATDIDPRAVRLAQHNAARVGADIRVLHGDLLEPLPAALRGGVRVLVANPPYLAARELAATMVEVREADPPNALVAGPTGHEVSDRLIAAAPAWLAPEGWLLLEIDERRASETARRCRAAGWHETRVSTDLAGRHRIVSARWPGERSGARADSPSGEC